MIRPDIDDLISDERERQEAKFGGQHSWGEGSCASKELPDTIKSLVLQEECGEVARAVLDQLDDSELVSELVQVAAVACAWLEALL